MELKPRLFMSVGGAFKIKALIYLPLTMLLKKPKRIVDNDIEIARWTVGEKVIVIWRVVSRLPHNDSTAS